MTAGALPRPRLAFFLPSLEGGGAERVTMNLVAGFAGRGFPIDVVLAAAEGPLLAMMPPGVRLIDLKSGTVLRSLRPLARYLRRERPAAMLAALNHANLVAMAAGLSPGVTTRMVISIHCTISKELERYHDVRTRTMFWLLGRLQRLADGIVAVSAGVADDAARTIGIPRQRVNVIYNPVVTQALLDSATRPAAHPWFEDSGPPVVLGVGRLTGQKNFLALIDAFALMRQRHEARLVILGEGEDRPALEARVRSRGLNGWVSLPGFVDNPYACMARAGVFVLSSDYEGLPTALIESLALGTPVVSTDCPSGPREILRGGTFGSLVRTGDVPALAEAIEHALSRERSRPPWEAIQPFTPEVVLEGYQRVLTPCTS